MPGAMKSWWRPIATTLASLVVLLALATAAHAQNADWTEPFPPFRIAGNLYYVGSKGLANYLITTPQGHILINSDLEANVPLIQASIEKLGFKFTDIKILLISHAHWDHDAASATIKQRTGAKYMVMDGDVPVVESGGKTDFQYGNTPGSLYPPTKVDRVLHDGDEVKLGDAVLVARLTPGHTKGCTTWTMKVTEGGKTYNVVDCRQSQRESRLQAREQSRRTRRSPRTTQTMFDGAEVSAVRLSFSGRTASYFDMEAKYARLNAGRRNPFVDPDGYKKFVAEKEQEFRAELAKQKSGVRRAE